MKIIFYLWLNLDNDRPLRERSGVYKFLMIYLQSLVRFCIEH